MNACQEWYRDRDRLLRSPVGPPGLSNPSPRWVAFICFLHELYLAVSNNFLLLLFVSFKLSGSES